MWWYESMESSQSFVSSLVSRDMVGGEIGQRDCWLENVRFPHEIQVEFSHSLETETETRLLRYPLLSLLLFFTWLFYSYLCNKLFLPHNSCRKYSHPSISLLSLPVMGLAAVRDQLNFWRNNLIGPAVWTLGLINYSQEQKSTLRYEYHCFWEWGRRGKEVFRCTSSASYGITEEIKESNITIFLLRNHFDDMHNDVFVGSRGYRNSARYYQEGDCLMF